MEGKPALEAIRLKLANEACCRVTGKTDEKIDPHHLIHRSDNGQDVPENVMPLANSFHVFEYHSGMDTRGAAVRIRAVMRPEEIDYIREVKGEAWLNHRYPLG